MTPLKRLFGLFRFLPRRKSNAARTPGPATHVVILDGTLSSLAQGYETNAGLTYKLLREVGRDANLTVYYEAGIQWRGWRDTAAVLAGHGIDEQITRAYGVLASRYKPGDRIFLIGYSRGAFAVRSLAGLIGGVGLLRREYATTRGVRQAFRHYQRHSSLQAVAKFRRRFCYDDTPIAAIGVWDTVRALGLPLIWRFSENRHDFHDHRLGAHVSHGLHAVALDERRRAYDPVMWNSQGAVTTVEQVWFRGTHADVGGHTLGVTQVRPLANIPLVWMLDRLSALGMALPDGWRDRFPCDPDAPSLGQWYGFARFFLWRVPRKPLQDPSERLHDSVRRSS
ncbi:DUF2235 domain-containing protein [Loktanella sp. SALINAS62]|uniref:DUF2235 domain-containing protein n=1 Tax=Loktanella sp. SALINAS62 TaxID=2706124 RepID=UPI001B8D137B